MAQSSFFGQSILDYNAVADKFENFNYDYTAMANKPCINGHKLLGGENTLQYLGITDFITGCITGVCERVASLEVTTAEHTQQIACVTEAVAEKSTVTVSTEGTSTDMISYITVNGVEKLLPGAATSSVNSVNGKAPVAGNVTVTGADTTISCDCATLICDKMEAIDVYTASFENAIENLTTSVESLSTTVNNKSTVSVSATGTSTDEVCYITVNGTEHKLAGGGGGSAITGIVHCAYDYYAESGCSQMYYSYDAVIGCHLQCYVDSFPSLDCICPHTLFLDINYHDVLCADDIAANRSIPIMTTLKIAPYWLSYNSTDCCFTEVALALNATGNVTVYGDTLLDCEPGHQHINNVHYYGCSSCYYPMQGCFTIEQLREKAIACFECTPESIATCTEEELIQLFKDSSRRAYSAGICLCCSLELNNPRACDCGCYMMEAEYDSRTLTLCLAPKS